MTPPLWLLAGACLLALLVGAWLLAARPPVPPSMDARQRNIDHYLREATKAEANALRIMAKAAREQRRMTPRERGAYEWQAGRMRAARQLAEQEQGAQR